MTAQTLQRASDAAISPAGQLVAPWTPGAQGGLDGRWYASSPAEPGTDAEPPLEGASASPQLGPPHGVSLHLTGHPQLSLWDRLVIAQSLLRCRCRDGEHAHNLQMGLCFDRQAKCHLTRRTFDADVPLARSERGHWSASGLVTCGHWTCPACGPRIAREVAGTLGAAIHRWLSWGEGMKAEEDPFDVWMLTVTIPHDRDDATELVVDRLYRAWSEFSRSRAWSRFAERVGVKARVRALDVTFGGFHGTHPHFHVALFVDQVPGHRWAAEQARELGQTGATSTLAIDPGLVDAWIRALRRVGVALDEKREADVRDIGLQLQGADAAARYFTKWGLADEVGATARKAGSPLILLDAHGAGAAGAGALYRGWRSAVAGRQVVTGLADLRTLVGLDDDRIDEYLAERQAELDKHAPPNLVAPLALIVRAHLWRAAARTGIANVIAEAERAELAGEDVQRAVDLFLWERLDYRSRLQLQARAVEAPS